MKLSDRWSKRPSPAAGTLAGCTRPRRDNAVQPVHRRAPALLALVLMLAWLPWQAWASCALEAASTVNFTLDSSINVPTGVAPGSVLYTSPPASPSGSATMNCFGSTRSGIENAVGGSSGGNGTLFPSGVDGVAYRIMRVDTGNPMQKYPNEPVGTGNVSFGGPFVLQLVATGPISNGSELSGGPLADWNVDMYWFIFPIGAQPAIHFTTTTTRFVNPACSVSVDPTVVTLPPVLSSRFSGPGSTAGQTPFDIALICSSGSTLSITLETGNAFDRDAGVIAAAGGGGNAQGMAVQVLDANGQPVSFGNSMPVGATPDGAFSVAFFARYYQTGPISGGQVKATATYTLSYQ